MLLLFILLFLVVRPYRWFGYGYYNRPIFYWPLFFRPRPMYGPRPGFGPRPPFGGPAPFRGPHGPHGGPRF